MHRFIAALLFALPLMAAPAQAGIAINGTRLLAWCNSDTPEDTALCNGYIVAVGDVLNDQIIFEGRACLPATTTVEELRTLVLLFLRANAAHLDKTSGANLAALAMAHAYPCKSGS